VKRRWRRPAVLAKRPRAAGGVPLSPAEIRDLRGPRTRSAFARQLGVSVATVYLWEAGRMRPSAPNLARLRRLVGRVRSIGGRARRVLVRTRARAARS
jgi:transcriptional regulator with XRE-family HTH domain